eukprot:s1566_g10.t1
MSPCHRSVARAPRWFHGLSASAPGCAVTGVEKRWPQLRTVFQHHGLTFNFPRLSATGALSGRFRAPILCLHGG